MDGQKVQSYKVTLKTGEWSVFTNDNHFENYEERLVSGIYGITTATTTNPVTRETVLSIEEVELKQ